MMRIVVIEIEKRDGKDIDTDRKTDRVNYKLPDQRREHRRE